MTIVRGLLSMDGTRRPN